MQVEPSDLLSLLRRGTRDAHSRLDARIDFGRHGVTLQRYAAFLDGMLTVVAPLEARLARWLGRSDGTSRTQRLEEALRSLGAPQAPRSADVRVPATLAEAYGCSYVLEGSTLGGMALAPVVERSLGDDVPTTWLRLRGVTIAASVAGRLT